MKTFFEKYNSTVIFLVLSMMSGVVELGAVFFGIQKGWEIYQIYFLVVWYQLGNLMLDFIPAGKKLISIGGLLSVVLAAINLNNHSYWLLAVQIVLCSYLIQAARKKEKVKCENSSLNTIKRVFRILGFAVSPIMVLFGGQAVILFCSLLSTCTLLSDFNNQTKKSARALMKPEFAFTMIWHQLHYFVYTYMMPCFLVSFLCTRFGLSVFSSSLCTSIAFAITWVVYIIPEIFKDTVYEKKHSRLIFYIGHSFLTVCLVGMTWFTKTNNPWGVLFFWLLTGMGGGTVFCIKRLTPDYKNMNMELSENIGHVCGPILAGNICYYCKEKALMTLCTVSCIFVLLAIGTATIAIERNRKHE